MRIKRNDNAFTGLEAAIVLIAFVVVAAVFSYVVLGAGFFTTQKSQEVVHTGISQASSSMEIIGNVYGYGSDSGTTAALTHVVFTVGNTAGGSPIDIAKMIITYISGEKNVVYQFDDVEFDELSKDVKTSPSANEWTIVQIINDNGNGNLLLEPGEQFVLAVKVENPTANQKFSLNLQPAVGSVFSIHKTAPPFINDVNILY